jgi:DNA-binding response OmpR family regulator
MSKIAIIEDDQAIREMYRIKFEAEGYKVAVAENGKRGLEIIQEMMPDIILLDLMMPEMTGDQMLAAMRKTDWGKNIKVVILTNVTKEEASENLETFGIEDYIIKAFYTPQQVIDMVENILKRK